MIHSIRHYTSRVMSQHRDNQDLPVAYVAVFIMNVCRWDQHSTIKAVLNVVLDIIHVCLVG